VSDELKPGSCRSCNAPILWVKMSSGRLMPLDAQPEKRVVMSEDGGLVRTCYRTHFETCPAAAAHRKAR
jgi:hypothetical protein